MRSPALLQLSAFLGEGINGVIEYDINGHLNASKVQVTDASPVITAREDWGAVRRGEGGNPCEYTESGTDDAAADNVA
jgi:hypothetical protein